MDVSSGSKQTATGNDRTANTRRTWTMYEEQTLIVALKDIVARGWKCDNGFRTGYLGTLEQAMVQAYPATDLKATPHIHSKVHVWKKQYGSITTMLSRSGFGWNDSMCTLDVADDHVWQEYVKTDANAKNMRYKSWPYYKDWQVIFGKDRATGEHAEEFLDALNDLAVSSKGKEVTNGEDFATSQGDLDPDNVSVNQSIPRADEATSEKTNSKSSKKRRRVEPFDRGMIEMMSTFIQNTEQQMSALVSRLGFEMDVSTARKQVFDALEPFYFLSFEERLNVTSRICDNSKDLDIFFCLSDGNKENMVRLILAGRY